MGVSGEWCQSPTEPGRNVEYIALKRKYLRLCTATLLSLGSLFLVRIGVSDERGMYRYLGNSNCMAGAALMAISW